MESSQSINLSSSFRNDLKKGETGETEVDGNTSATTDDSTSDHPFHHHSSMDHNRNNNNASFQSDPLPTPNDSEIFMTSTISKPQNNHHQNQDHRSSSIRVDTLKSEVDHLLMHRNKEDSSALPPMMKANLESLTINKLHYDAVGMVGRETELKRLESCFAKLETSSSSSFRQRTMTMMSRPSFAVQNSAKSNLVALEGPPKQLLWIKGYSGSGKSTLAKTLEDLVGETDQGLLIEGKYDQKNTNEPCSAILAAFGQIFQHFALQWDEVQLIKDTATNIVDQLVLALGINFDILCHMIPYFEQVVQKKRKYLESDEGSSLTSASDSDSDSSYHRYLHNGFGAQQECIKYAFQILTRVLSSHFHPLVIVLDDLQWVDRLSLDVLDYLMTDKQNFNPVMFVGCYRSNEVNHNHILTEEINNLSTKTGKYNLEMTNVEVGNLSVSSVNQVIRKMMAMEDDEATITAGLAELCHKRTLGNPHFLIQFMTMLYDEELLTYNLGLLKWKWDEQEIERVTMSTDNVVDMVKARMKKLSPELQQVLKHAACLGASFNKDSLDLVYSEHSDIGKASRKLLSTASLLQILEENNYIEYLEGKVIVWVHDKVQEAALELIGESRNSFQFEVGCILFNSFDKTMLEECLFVVVDLINQGHVKRRFDFAELNLRAALKAKSLSAFHSAASYVQHGIQLLPREKWSANFELTHQLYTLGAQVELAVGNGRAMESYYREAIAQKQALAIDKLPLYVSKLEKLSCIDMQWKQSIAFTLDILKKFGCNLVWNQSTAKLEAIRAFRNTIDVVKKLPKDFHRTQRSMTDPKHKAVMILLSKLWYICHTEGAASIQCLGTTKMVQMTIEYGVHDTSGSGFATFAMFMVCFSGDWEGARAIAETALLLQRRVQNEYTAALTYFANASCVFHWTNPVQSCLVPFMDAFQAGMRSGNVTIGISSILAHNILLPFFLGKPLDILLARVPDVHQHMEEVRHNQSLLRLELVWQMFLNLSGHSAETTKLRGEVFDADQMATKTPFDVYIRYWGELQLYSHYGDWESGAKLSLKIRKIFQRTEKQAADFLAQTFAFHWGLPLYAKARHSKKQKYKRAAKRALNLLAKWVQKGCPNVRHYYTLFQAEQASLDKKYEAAEALYKEAIVMAARPGLIHDAAIFNARYNAFLRQSGPYFIGLEDEAKYRLQESIRYYDEWGAKKIVAMQRGRLQMWL